MTDTEKCWVLMECVDVYRDGHEHPGEQNMQISPPMTKKQAFKTALQGHQEARGATLHVK